MKKLLLAICLVVCAGFFIGCVKQTQTPVKKTTPAEKVATSTPAETKESGGENWSVRKSPITGNCYETVFLSHQSHPNQYYSTGYGFMGMSKIDCDKYEETMRAQANEGNSACE
ncbi:hypothetical protein HQ571_05475 [Candidatus Kuenenbacteria bacterium]|nr:hypothetical protein [Candidatus Kuenenbacteria bacterium]